VGAQKDVLSGCVNTDKLNSGVSRLSLTHVRDTHTHTHTHARTHAQAGAQAHRRTGRRTGAHACTHARRHARTHRQAHRHTGAQVSQPNKNTSKAECRFLSRVNTEAFLSSLTWEYSCCLSIFLPHLWHCDNQPFRF